LENPVKKLIAMLLLGAFIATTSISVVGCKDEVKEKTKSEKKTETTTEKK